MLTRSARVAFCLALLAATSVYGQSSVVELNDAGWKMIERGDGAKAARLFNEALAAKPDDPVLLFGAGTAAHLQGQPREALARLQRAVDVDPRLVPASRLLGEIAYKEGDVRLAIATYEKALKYAPDDSKLSNRLAAWRADADVHRNFEERRYDRFKVMFQGHADEALAARATEVLNAAFWRIGNVLGAFPADAVVVMLYTEQQFRDITRAPEWAGGIFDGRIRIPAAGAPSSGALFERVLVHELTHAMIASIAPRGIPAWLHEGLAQHFEGDDVPTARRRVQAAGAPLPLRGLEHSFARLSAGEAQVAYDESLLAVDVIMERPAFGWIRLLNALAQSDRTEAMLESFGFSYAELEHQFRR